VLEPLLDQNEEIKYPDPELIYQQMDNEEIPEEPPTHLVQSKRFEFEKIKKFVDQSKPRSNLWKLQSQSHD
jgi:hypothetical protein